MSLRARVWITPVLALALVFVPAARAVAGPSRPLGHLRGRAERAVPGDLDPAFGTGGIVTMDFAGPSGARTVNIQPDGQIVAGGWTTALSLHADFALARFNPDGTLDQTFGTGGEVTTDLGQTEYVRGIGFESTGAIVAVGDTKRGRSSDLAIVRYNPDGTLDTTFGTGGIVILDLGGREVARAVAIQPDDQIIVGGFTDTPGHFIFALARLDTTGALDPTFGTGGTVTTDLGFAAAPWSIALQSDGKILAGGGGSNVEGAEAGIGDFALLRYNADGTLDDTFGVGGVVTTDFGADDEIRTVCVQSDGQIVGAGLTSSNTLRFSYFALARYNPDGTLDTTYGTGGTVIATPGYNTRARAMALEPDDQAVEVGYTLDAGASDFIVARFDTDGTLDSTFGSGGWVRTDLGGVDGARGVAIQADGNIVAAGYSGPTRSFTFGLTRYLGA